MSLLIKFCIIIIPSISITITITITISIRNSIIAFVKERFLNAVEIDILGIFEVYSSLQIWPPKKIFQCRNYYYYKKHQKVNKKTIKNYLKIIPTDKNKSYYLKITTSILACALSDVMSMSDILAALIFLLVLRHSKADR